MRPRNDLDAFIKDRNVFKNVVVKDIQNKLSGNYMHFPRCEALNAIEQNCSDSIFIKVNKP